MVPELAEGNKMYSHAPLFSQTAQLTMFEKREEHKSKSIPFDKLRDLKTKSIYNKQYYKTEKGT